jgi:hypothetical protein
MAITPRRFDRHDRSGQPSSLAAVSQPPSHATTQPPVPPAVVRPSPAPNAEEQLDPVLCQHCGRTAANGISCIGMCVADSGY